MHSPVVKIEDISRVLDIKRVLETTSHGAFPVMHTDDEGKSHICGIILRDVRIWFCFQLYLTR